MDCMIWQEMFGKFARIGTMSGITPILRISQSLITLQGQKHGITQ